jgi:hypothetical protein
LRLRTGIYLLCIITLIPVFWWITGKPLYNYLSLNIPEANAEVLIVEGWLDGNQLLKVKEEISKGRYSLIITTSVPSDKYFTMGKNGSMKFCFEPSLKYRYPVPLSVSLLGTLTSGMDSKFTVFCNDLLIGSDSIANKPKSFLYEIPAFDFISSISVNFLNDALISGRDRNLLVEGISVNYIYYTVNDTNVYYYVNTYNDSSVTRSARCKSIAARNILIDYGINKDKILYFCADKTGFSRTLSNAKHTSEFIRNELKNKEISAINIISAAPHSRRSLLSYKKSTKDYKFGIITIPEEELPVKMNRFRNLREFSGILFVMISPLIH